MGAPQRHPGPAGYGGLVQAGHVSAAGLWSSGGAGRRELAGDHCRIVASPPAAGGMPTEVGVYIVAIAWLYVTLLMAAAETSIVAGVLTFVFYGLAPLSLLLWLFGVPQRRRNRQRRELTQEAPPE